MEEGRGLILLIVFVAFCLWIGGDIVPDIRGDGGYEPCQVGGNPNWQDC